MILKQSLSFLLCREVNNVFNMQRNLLPGIITTLPVRCKWNEMLVMKVKPGPKGAGGGGYYRRVVHYPEDNKYTIKPLKYTNLAGRDRVTGRVVVKTLGGGMKHPFLWVDYHRRVPEGEPPLIERVLEIIPEPNRTAHVALVGHGDKLRYVLATENMKPGDLITTSSELTRIAVRANEGDAYPLGSLPVGTTVCNVELRPGTGAFYARAAGTFCTILRKKDERVVLMLPHKCEYSLNPKCMAVVGSVSNPNGGKMPIGSPNRLRWLGYRPRSGLWHRKTGYHGRKIYKPKACVDIPDERREKAVRIKLFLDDFPHHPAEYPAK